MKQHKTPVLYFAILFNPIILAWVWTGLSTFLKICRFGGLHTNVPKAAWALATCVVWFFGWTFIFRLKRELFCALPHHLLWSAGLLAELVVLFAMLGYTGYQAWQYTQDFTTKIGWYLYKYENTVSFTLKNDNLYTDGCGALMDEFRARLDWPEEIYVSNFFQIDFDKTGEITYIYAFLYGENENGELKSYLVDYNRSQSLSATVWIDGYVTASYDPDMLLQPMVELVDKMDLKTNAEEIPADSLGLLYYGRRSLTTDGATLYLVSESGTQTQVYEPTTGYEVSLYSPNDASVLPRRFFADWGMELPESPLGESETETERPEHETGVSFLDEENNLQFFVDSSVGYRLRVTDAAAGSRFYVLDQTTDGGLSWNCINEDPFAGRIGNNVNMVFFDESFGFLQLPNGSNDTCRLYRTEDGGLTLTQVELPISGDSQYDYPFLPELTGDTLTLTVGTGFEGDYSQDSSSFVSTDMGLTWILE